MQKLQIDSDTWATLNRLLDEALDLPQSELERWLNTLPADVAPLEPQLRRLLERTGAVETGEFLHTLPKLDLAPGDLAAAPVRVEQQGDAIGPYRLVRELGSGGMGVVWLAERSDGLINRPVALKLPHGAWKRAGLAERMAREREILASLTHPNIAHLYDAGVTADGQPYLAIEFVEGRPIDVFCKERGLGVRARLILFAQVAKAVAYAHGKLVVHRDLKPANILVSAEGQARLLDFGIAKLLDEGSARETRFTEVSGRALTPDYASPEQILGEPLTVASDVYSLGVVLYELLCGERPYKLRRGTRGALEEAILKAEPGAPSDLLSSPERRQVRGDLDTVVLKALKKNPGDRYPTTHALLDDIERYLDSRPVLAQPDSRWYRFGKFVARNKVAVGSATGILVAVLAGAGVAAWQARVAFTQKERAEEIQEFIAAVFREADPTQGKGKSLSASELLLQAERRLNERTDATPEMRVQLLAILGESLFGLQDIQESARIYEEALRVQASASPDAELTSRLHLGLSQAYEYIGRDEDGLTHLRESLTTLESAGLTATPLFVRVKLQESVMGLVTRDYALTESAGNEAIRAASKIIGPRSMEAATAMQLISKSYLFVDREAEAVSLSKQALDLMLANYHGDYSHPRVFESTQYYVNALIHVGELDTAAALIQDALAMAIKVLGAESRMVGEIYGIAVPSELERGNLRKAIEMARKSISIYLLDSLPNSGVHSYRALLLAHSLVAARAGSEAVSGAEDSVRISAAARANPQGAGRGVLGLALVYDGKFAEGEAQMRRALAEGDPKRRSMHQAMRFLGTALRLQGKSAEAIPWYEQALATATQSAFDRNDRAIALAELGLSHLELGDTRAADEAFKQSEAIFIQFQRQYVTPARVDLMIGTARAQMQRSEFAAALPALQKADAFWRDFSPDSRWAGEAALWLGKCLMALDRTREGREALSRAQTLLAASPFPTDARLIALTRIRD